MAWHKDGYIKLDTLLYWLFAGDKSGSASEYFQPFSKKMSSSYSYYDITEFIVYVVGVPLAIWGIPMIWKKLKEEPR